MEMLESDKVVVLSNAAAEAKEDKLHRLKRHRQRILEVKPFDYEGGIAAWDAGADDKIMKGASKHTHSSSSWRAALANCYPA